MDDIRSLETTVTINRYKTSVKSSADGTVAVTLKSLDHDNSFEGKFSAIRGSQLTVAQRYQKALANAVESMLSYENRNNK